MEDQVNEEKIVKYDLTNEQVDNIVSLVIERVLTRMPKVIGNLMAQQATANKVKKDFYKKYPEFEKHKDVVVDVVGKIEGKNLTLSLEQIMEKAIPEIRQKIKMKQELDVDNVKTFHELDKKVSDLTDIEKNKLSLNNNNNNDGFCDNGII